jgi:hypothetical protein
MGQVVIEINRHFIKTLGTRNEGQEDPITGKEVQIPQPRLLKVKNSVRLNFINRRRNL